MSFGTQNGLNGQLGCSNCVHSVHCVPRSEDLLLSWDLQISDQFDHLKEGDGADVKQYTA